FIVLAALADPQGGWLKRVLLAMIEGLTLGTLTQSVYAPITGYLAFFVLALFLIGLALLPSRLLPRTSNTSDTDTTLARREDGKARPEPMAGECPRAAIDRRRDPFAAAGECQQIRVGELPVAAQRRFHRLHRRRQLQALSPEFVTGMIDVVAQQR